MLCLNLNEEDLPRDPKDSIEEALRVARTLQIVVALVFHRPWLGLTLEVTPSDQLDPALARFDALVERHREHYAQWRVSVRWPTRADMELQ